MIRLLLIGPTGVGKSLWGPWLAQHLDLQYLDLDQALRLRYHSPNLAADLLNWGLPLFYQRSLSILQDYLKAPEAWLIALGAGTQFAAQGKAELLLAPTLCLWAQPQWLWQQNRQQRQDPRTFQAFRATEFHPWRKQLYRACPYFLDCTDQSPEAMMSALQKLFPPPHVP